MGRITNNLTNAPNLNKNFVALVLRLLARWCIRYNLYRYNL